MNRLFSNFPLMKKSTLYLLFLIGSLFQLHAQDNLRLWYEQPSEDWMQSVPLGNGRLGAMPDGQVFNEHIILNDITLWSGSPQDADREGAVDHLDEIRKLIFEGKNDEAEALVNEHFISKGRGSGFGNGANDPYGSYQILGDLHLNHHFGKDSSSVEVKEYSRDLALNTALATTEFSIDGVHYKREYFTSFSDDVIVIKISADRAGKISFGLALDRPERFETSVANGELTMKGQLNDGTEKEAGMKYLTRVQIKQDGGELTSENSGFQVKNADSAIIYITAGTDFRDFPYVEKTKENMEKALAKTYELQKKEHIANYQKLFHKVSLTLSNSNKEDAELPTDKRLVAYAQKGTDDDLPVLYFQFGRYLLISSTRPGLLPPNLQGLWANAIQAPWNGDYHFNINYQMNHWPLDVTNLSELNEPFFTLIEGLVEPGKKTAKTYYGGEGWVAHVITNVWGYTSPGEQASWGSTNSGSGWLSNLLWRHYDFTRDEDYLKKLYPIIKGSAEFYLSTLVEDPRNGWLVTAPSNSPENGFRMKNGKVAHIDAAPTIDNQIIRELFANVIQASVLLDTDEAFREELEKAKGKLPPNQIDQNGRLMEWLYEHEEVEPTHRHVSPLWGLYPGSEISPADTPKLAEASKKLLERRGDISTGWSLAWKINFWARLRDGNHSLKLLKDLLRPVAQKGINMSNGGGTYPNLFDAHPPFQIDGNFGATAGIAEMLVQSQAEAIELLPALPDRWAEGSFKGLRVRGAGVIDAEWKNNRLTKVTLKAEKDHVYKLLLPKGQPRLKTDSDGKVNIENGIAEITLNKGEQIELNFSW